jgi:hypothetical protein
MYSSHLSQNTVVPLQRTIKNGHVDIQAVYSKIQVQYIQTGSQAHQPPAI